MDKKKIEQKVKEILADRLDTDIAKIKLNSHIRNDLGMDSFEAVEFIFYIKENFSINIPDGDMRKIEKVEDIVNYLIMKGESIDGEK